MAGLRLIGKLQYLGRAVFVWGNSDGDMGCRSRRFPLNFSVDEAFRYWFLPAKLQMLFPLPYHVKLWQHQYV